MERADRWLGQTLKDRYRVLERVAEGGMGAIYVAEQLQLHKKVALKMLHPHLAGDPEIVERFRREALAASAIGDAHIVEILDLDSLEDEGAVFIAMELLEGQDLAKAIGDDGPLSVARCVHIARQSARALAAAHEVGIVHRDLKPENVFLVERGGDPDFVKLLDFGVSKLTAAIDGVEQPSATRTGTALGTPHYMAPEQAQGRRSVDRRVDVYALGVMCFRMLTAQHPFEDESFPALIVKLCTDPPPPVRRYRGDVPEGLERAILRMLEKDPDDRFADMAEVEAALAEFADHESEPELLDAPPTSASTARAFDRQSTDPLAKTALQDAPEAVRARPRDDDDAPPPPVGGASSAAKLMLLLMGAAVLALAAWAAVGMLDDPDAEAEAAFPELPEPAAPRTRAMVSTQGGFGWRWVNPRPRAMPTWYGVDVAAGGERMVMVGVDGAAVRYDEGSLFSWRTGTGANLNGVAWTGAREALIVGDHGVLSRLGTESGPEPLVSGVTTPLRAVVATSPTEALVAGDEGVLLRVVGSDVRRLELSTTADLVGALARGHQTFVVGSRGTILRVEGRTVATEASGVDTTLRGVGGCADGAVYAVGDHGVLLRRRAAGGWGRVRTTGQEGFTAVSCDHGRVAVARANGEVLLVSGDRTVRLETGFDRAWHALRGGRDGSTWLVGTGGRLATIEANHIWTRSDGPTVPLRALGSMGGALVAVGEYGRILRERESGLEQVESPTESGLAALVQIDDGHLLALGDYGAIVDIRYDRATLLTSPTDTSLRGGVADAESQALLLVGAEGVVVRGTLQALSSSRIPDVGDLWAVTGTPTEALAVGDDGVVLRLTDSGFSRVACAADRTLHDVVRTAEGTWAVGDGGLIVRIEDGGCATEASEGVDLHAIGVGPEGRPIAGGDDGTVLERGADGSWARVNVDVGGASVRAIWRSGRSVYLGGTRGALVRHVRMDL